MLKSLIEAGQDDRPSLALTLILTALLVLSFQDAMVKLASPTTTLWQFQAVRAVFNILLLTCFLSLTGLTRLMRPKKVWPLILRTIIMVAAMIFFFAGAPFLTLSQMAAGLYTFPVFMAILGWLVLGERVGPIRIGAMVIAIIGAILILRPFSEEFLLVQLLPVATGLCYAVNTIVLRTICKGENTFTLAFWLAFGFLICTALGILLVPSLPVTDVARSEWPFFLEVWPELTLVIVGLAAVASIANVTGNVLIVRAYQSAELSWLAPFDYSYLAFATLWGLLLFGDVPDQGMLLGMLLVAIGGIIMATRTAPITRRKSVAIG